MVLLFQRIIRLNKKGIAASDAHIGRNPGYPKENRTIVILLSLSKYKSYAYVGTALLFKN